MHSLERQRLTMKHTSHLTVMKTYGPGEAKAGLPANATNVTNVTNVTERKERKRRKERKNRKLQPIGTELSFLLNSSF